MNNKSLLIIGIVVLVAFGIYNNFEKEIGQSPFCTCNPDEVGDPVNPGDSEEFTYCGDTCCNARYDPEGDESFDVDRCLPIEGDDSSCQSPTACWACLAEAARKCREEVLNDDEKNPIGILTLDYCSTIFKDNDEKCWDLYSPLPPAPKNLAVNELSK